LDRPRPSAHGGDRVGGRETLGAEGLAGPRHRAPTRGLAGLPGRALPELVRARAGGDSRAASRWVGYVRAGHGEGELANYRAALDQRRVRHREPLALVPGPCVFGDAADQEKEPEHKSYYSGGQHVHLPFGRRPGVPVAPRDRSVPPLGQRELLPAGGVSRRLLERDGVLGAWRAQLRMQLRRRLRLPR